MIWQSPISFIQKVFNFISDYLSEVWLFSTAVFILWHPAFGDRLQNSICVAGLMSVASALARMKKLEHKIDEMRATQLLEAGRHIEKDKKKAQRRGHEQKADPTEVPAGNADDVGERTLDDDGRGLCADISSRDENVRGR